MQELIQIEDKWYVLATSSRAADRTRVLKHGETFGVFDCYGDIQALGDHQQGLYHEGTRFLSRLELRINQARPLLLNSAVGEDNSLLMVDLTTPDLYEPAILRDTLHIFRAKVLWEGVQYEHLRLRNYGEQAMNLHLDVLFAADYADIFEVRGLCRAKRGAYLPLEHHGRELILGYRGLDGITRRTRLLASSDFSTGTDDLMCFSHVLMPRQEWELWLTSICEIEARTPPVVSYEGALERWNRAAAAYAETVAQIHTSNDRINAWLNRSAADLRMLTTDTPYGPYPYAGVPWFSAAFGRDGLITALQCLWLQPELARGVLGFLAATQAERDIPVQDAKPGKILHELRHGEMAALAEIPFHRYYGSVDATPLFIVLAGAYFERTGDRAFLQTLWPHIKRALAWIDNHGDLDRDGFVEYARQSANGLVHQGWKDSADAVFHTDGGPAQAPIALCEVQGYVYAAKQAAAKLALLFGEHDYEAELNRQVERLNRRFNETFWCDAINTFALALDAHKRPCQIATSNAGHALFTGIAEPERARRVAETLLNDASFSGWGVRTVAEGAARFNPMSYHNGSVWPHDNGILAMGLARYGFKDKVLRIFTGLFQVSAALELQRLPELFCGFPRRPGQGPTQYPVACVPQAWASGTVFHLLQACLGLTWDSKSPHLRFFQPVLPDELDWLELKNLRYGKAVIDLFVRRQGRYGVQIQATRQEGKLDIAVIDQ